MLAHLRDRFWWPRMGEDIKWYVQTCHECQVRQMKKIHILPTVPASGSLFRKIYVDVMHMLASKRFKYILHARCSLSGWPEYVVLKKQTANTVADFLWKTQCRFGGLFEVVTDNATNMIVGVRLFQEKYHTHVIRISPFNSKAAGPIERQHRDVRKAIMKTCQESPLRTGLSAHGARCQALSKYARGTRRLRGDTLKTSEALRAVR